MPTIFRVEILLKSFFERTVNAVLTHAQVSVHFPSKAVILGTTVVTPKQNVCSRPNADSGNPLV